MDLDEPVQVGVLCAPGQIRPVWFRWGGRKVEIKAVTMRWRSTQGRVLLSHFAVTDGLNLYELTVNHHSLTWRLTKTDG